MIKLKNSTGFANLCKSCGIRLVALLVLFSLAMSCLVSCGKKEQFEYPNRTLAEDAQEYTFGSYKYNLYDDGTAVITKYLGSEEHITVPDKVDGKTVSALANDAFYQNTTVRSVRLGKNLEVIGDYCFAGCESLYSIEIPDSVWSIGAGAFEETAWLATKNEEFVTVGDEVLIKYNGSGGYVEIPDTVKHIGGAFDMNADIVYVRIPDSVYTIGSYSFFGCDSLCAVDFGSSIQYIGVYAFGNCSKLTTLELPDSLEYIDAFAFSSLLAVSSIRLGSSLKYIGENAFYYCYWLRTIHIPSSLETVGSYAFSDCYALELIFYSGTEEQFNALELDNTNFALIDIDKVYGVK